MKKGIDRFVAKVAKLGVTCALAAGGFVLVTLVGTSGGGVVPAGADTPGYTATCTLTGVPPIAITGTVTTGSLPSSVPTASTFNLSNFSLVFTLPDSGLFALSAGATISGTYTTTVSATGVTPSSEAATFTLPSGTIPNPFPSGGYEITAPGTMADLTAQDTSGPATVSMGTSGTMSLSVNGSAIPLDCTNPAEQIASTDVVPAGALWVAQGGQDTGTCTSQSSPCATVTYAISQATTANPTIEVSGTISDNVDITVPVTITGALAPASSPAVIEGASGAGEQTIEIGKVDATLNDVSIEGGSSPNFGGGIVNGGTLTITDSTITGNTASQAGGGIWNDANLTVTDSTISGNTSSEGAGGLFNQPSASATITDSTVTGNTAPTAGGLANAGDMTLTADTIVGNTATAAGAFGGFTQAEGTFSVGATIVAGNTGGNCGAIAGHGVITSVGYNLTDDTTGAACGFTQSTDIVNADPDLGALANNGGPTDTLLPATASPAARVIPSGTSLNGGSVCPSTDQRGDARPAPGATACTIGAVEAPLPGYYEVASDGGIFAFNAPFDGSMGGQPLNKPVVGMATDPTTAGYYEVASDGGIFAFNAPFSGSMGGQPLNKPVVGMAFDPTTGGYYEVASDGGIFAFNAPFYGSMGGQPLNKPIVGMAFDPSTGGYYEVASDGGIFAFNAPFDGSMGGQQLNKPVVGMAFDSTTAGYYEVASDGGIFAFNAPFSGSMGGKTLNQPMVGMAFDPTTGGYDEVASDGGIFAFNAPFFGSMGGMPLNKPVVGIAISST